MSLQFFETSIKISNVDVRRVVDSLLISISGAKEQTKGFENKPVCTTGAIYCLKRELITLRRTRNGITQR